MLCCLTGARGLELSSPLPSLAWPGLGVVLRDVHGENESRKLGAAAILFR